MIAWSSHIDYENLNVSRLSWRPSLKVVAVRSHILPSLGAMQAARRMAMLFPGQGGQCSGMALHLQGNDSRVEPLPCMGTRNIFCKISFKKFDEFYLNDLDRSTGLLLCHPKQNFLSSP